MNRDKLQLLVGTLLIVAIATAMPVVAVVSILYLWVIYRRTTQVISKGALFRTAATGGIVGALLFSSFGLAAQLATQSQLQSKLNKLRAVAEDAGLVSSALNWTLISSTVYFSLGALLFAWAVTLVADYLPQPKTPIASQ